MRRREFLAALGAAFVAIDARAQQRTQQLGPKKRIAIVSTTTKVEDFKRHPAYRLFDDELKRGWLR
jgi:hypothetical protein